MVMIWYQSFTTVHQNNTMDSPWLRNGRVLMLLPFFRGQETIPYVLERFMRRCLLSAEIHQPTFTIHGHKMKMAPGIRENGLPIGTIPIRELYITKVKFGGKMLLISV